MRPLVAHRFVVFGPQHLQVLGAFLVGCIAVLLLAGRLRTRPRTQAIALRVAGVLILASCTPFELHDLLAGLHDPRTGLPLQICDFAWIIAGVALITRSPRWSALLYYWGLTLCIQGVVTPDLTHVFPSPQYFGFWLRHIPPVWAAVYLLGARAGPTWRGYRFTIVVTAVWAALVMSLNGVFGSNYGYLNGKPAINSALNLLGPWPWYVLVEVVLIAGVWALITWPWNRRGPIGHR